jgi:Zn-dependent protease
MDPNLKYFLVVLTAISLIWAVLNLLPILPMDGGRLVETALGPENRRTALLISAISGVVVCIISITVFNQPILAIFVGMFAFQSFKALKEPTWR